MRSRYEVIAVRPTLEQDELDLLELQYERHRSQLGMPELFESGLAGDLTG
ncbi:MAG TPA: hypothetical protein VGI23_08980 [Steroidobacteraceae bacterium]